jgi:hypothetical protein
VKIIFQTVEDLHTACPRIGTYRRLPTPGNRVVNKAFMNFYEGKDARAIIVMYLNLFIGYSSEFLLVSVLSFRFSSP